MQDSCRINADYTLFYKLHFLQKNNKGFQVLLKKKDKNYQRY